MSADLLNLPSNTVVGRLASSNGGSESIPFATLSVALGIGGSNFFLASNIAGTNTITGTTPLAAALLNAQVIFFVPANTNTGATTFNRDGLGAVNVFCNNAALIGGEIQAGIPIMLYYDGANYHILEALATADGQVLMVNASDITKKLKISLAGITTGTTRTITMPDSNVNLNGLSGTQTANTIYAGPTSGAAALPSFRPLVGAESSLVLIATAAASNSATINFASGFDATKYEEYILEGSDVVPATDGDSGVIRFSIDGGLNYRATAADYVFATSGRVNTGSDVPYDSSTAVDTTAIFLTSSAGVANTSSAGGLNFRATMKGLSSTTQNKMLLFNSCYLTSGAASFFALTGAGSAVSSTLKGSAVNAIRFLFVSGNAVSGTFRLYGVRKT